MSDKPPVTDSIRLFKTLARVARFHGDTDPGLAAGVRRALELMPFFKEHFARVRGKCTNTDLLNLAGTTTKTLARYQSGEGLSRARQGHRRLAIELLDRSVMSIVLLTEDDVSALFRGTS